MTNPPTPIIRMRDAGYYSANTVGARHVIDSAIPLMAHAVAGMPLGDGPFTVADFGAADGGTSLGLHRALVAAIRARAPERQVALTYTDLPHNDFSTLFKLTQDGLADLPGVFVFASGSSFYRQIFPHGTLRLGFSGTAMHWLSRLPGPLADAVHAVLASDAERAVFARQAADDWQAILLHRAAELTPGGRLVLANFCQDESGHYLGYTGGRNMHDSFARHWRWLRDTGAITSAEYAAASFPQYYKTVAEFRAPFDNPDTPVSRAGLRLLACETRVTPCPYAARFAADGDAEAFAAAYVPTLRSWSENVFLGALDPARSAEARRAIVDAFYAAYQRDVAAAPQGHAMDYVHCFMLIGKAE
jgi:SAM dependent carboxyl methyltransferase